MDRKMREKTTNRSYSYVQKLIEWLSAIHLFYWWPMIKKKEEVPCKNHHPKTHLSQVFQCMNLQKNLAPKA